MDVFCLRRSFGWSVRGFPSWCSPIVMTLAPHLYHTLWSHIKHVSSLVHFFLGLYGLSPLSAIRSDGPFQETSHYGAETSYLCFFFASSLFYGVNRGVELLSSPYPCSSATSTKWPTLGSASSLFLFPLPPFCLFICLNVSKMFDIHACLVLDCIIGL